MYIFLSIEGIPLIIRFKTFYLCGYDLHNSSIESSPVIIRFKTLLCQVPIKSALHRIEGSPLITRFKTRKGLQPILLELLY